MNPPPLSLGFCLKLMRFLDTTKRILNQIKAFSFSIVCLKRKSSIYCLLAATPLEASSVTLNVWFCLKIIRYPSMLQFKFLRYLGVLRRSLYT